MLLAVCTIQVKKKGKKRLKKKEKKQGYEKFAFRGFEPGPSESVRNKKSITSVNAANASLKEVYIPSLW